MYTKEQIQEAWKIAKQYNIGYFGAIGHNIKTSKSDAKTDYLTYMMYLAPHNQSGYNTCPMASNGCAAACLYTAGHGRYKNVQDARIRRTKFYFEHRDEFKACVFSEIQKAKTYAKNKGRKLACRLNGTSDIVWERTWPELFEYFNDVQFYEYTKIWSRLMSGYNKPQNLYLTLSRSESNQKYIEQILKNNSKANVAVVFQELPDKWMGRKVINGDEMDLRVLDPKGVIVGLKIKGRAIHDKTGFVVKSE
jgi:hypothetical protein